MKKWLEEEQSAYAEPHKHRVLGLLFNLIVVSKYIEIYRNSSVESDILHCCTVLLFAPVRVLVIVLLYVMHDKCRDQLSSSDNTPSLSKELSSYLQSLSSIILLLDQNTYII